MHDIVFKMKRAFQSTLRATRPLLEPFGVTAARFDMLFALRRRQPMLQSTLRRSLGVAAPTVSRMLRSLEHLDLVRRWPPTHDTRQRLIELTARGRALIRRAARALVWRGQVERMLVAVLLPESRECLEVRRILAFEDLNWSLIAMGAGFGDTGDLWYPPWHPDD